MGRGKSGRVFGRRSPLFCVITTEAAYRREPCPLSQFAWLAAALLLPVLPAPAPNPPLLIAYRRHDKGAPGQPRTPPRSARPTTGTERQVSAHPAQPGARCPPGLAAPGRAGRILRRVSLEPARGSPQPAARHGSASRHKEKGRGTSRGPCARPLPPPRDALAPGGRCRRSAPGGRCGGARYRRPRREGMRSGSGRPLRPGRVLRQRPGRGLQAGAGVVERRPGGPRNEAPGAAAARPRERF